MSVKYLVVIALISILKAVFTGDAMAQNVFHGTCADFENYIEQHGVVDNMGVAHRHKSGWTNVTFSAEPTYSSPHQVQASGHNAGKVCFAATVRVTYIATPVTRMLSWQPVGCDQNACNALRDDYQARLANHEAVHAREAAAEASSLTHHSQAFTVTACANFQPHLTWQSVRSEFDRQVLAVARQVVQRAERNYSRSSDAFDNSPPGEVPLSCGTCIPCPPCPQGQVMYNGQCLSRCVSPQDCGFSASQQPVACCAFSTSTGTVNVCSPYHTSICTER